MAINECSGNPWRYSRGEAVGMNLSAGSDLSPTPARRACLGALANPLQLIT